MATKPHAKQIAFTPTGGGLTSTTTQDAILEVNERLNITQLQPASAPLTNTDLLMVQQSGTNKKITAAIIKAEFAADAITAASAANSAKIAAETARDAAQLSAGVYNSTAAGLSATTNGKYFSVVGSNTNDYLNLYLNNSGSAVLQKTYPSAASVDNPFRYTLGAFFHNPHYEVYGTNMYFKPSELNGYAFFIRGGYLANAQKSYTSIKNQLLTQIPALDSSLVELNVTSPSGVADCIMFKGASALWYNPSTDDFFAGDRNTKRQNAVLMIHCDFGRVGECQEDVQMHARLNSSAIFNEAWKYECPIITSLSSPYFPNIDTNNGVMTIPNDTLLFYRNTAKSIPTTSINLTTITSTAKKIYYNPTTELFEVKAWSTALTNSEQLNLVLVATIRYNGTNTGVSIACPYTINGTFNGGNGGIGTIDQSLQFAAIFTPLTSVTTSTNYPEYNTSTRTFILYADTILMYGNKRWVTTADQVVDVGIKSSANKIFWDTSTDTLYSATWSTVLTPDQRSKSVLVATIRQSDTVPATMSIMCPYTINGKLFGYDLAGGITPNTIGASIEGIHHRGFSGVAPENTIPAYIKSAEYLNSYVEGDIRWTSDGVAVLLHDDTIDRTSNGTGAIANMTLATAKSYDFGSWKGSEYTGTTIPTFEEVVKVLKKLSLYGYFEIKADITEARAQQLLTLVKKYKMMNNIEFDSFNYATLQAIVAVDPTQTIGYLGALSSDFIALCVALKTGSNKVTAAVISTSVTSALVELAHLNDINVVCWTVDNASDVPTLAGLGVDGIMTNTLNIAALLRESEGI